MQGITGKAAQKAQAFHEIPGESVSQRRVRYWEWRKVKAKLEGKRPSRGKALPDGRKINIKELTRQFHELTRQVEAMQKELAKRGYTFQVGE